MATQEEVMKKHAEISELLKKNPFMPPTEIIKTIAKDFGSGVSRTEIAQIRWAEHGIKLGPGGYATDRKGNRVEAGVGTEQRPTPPPSAALGDSGERLSKMIRDLQAEMKLNRVAHLHIPMEGPVEAVQTVRRTIMVPRPSA